MRTEDAIQIIKYNSCYECSYGCDSAYTCDCGACELKDAVQTLVEKQISKKPYKNRSEYYCPSCYEDEKSCVGKNHIDGHKTRKAFCFNCGQRIDWSEVEE